MTYLARCQATFGEDAPAPLFHHVSISEFDGSHGYELRGDVAWHHSADRYETPEEAAAAGAAALAEMNPVAARMWRVSA